MAILKEISNQFTPGQNHHLLNAWQRLMLEDIWHFNQIIGKGAPLETSYDKGGTVYLQRERELIGRHLEQCALKIAHETNYWPCPAYFTDHQFVGRGKPLRNQTFRTNWARLIEFGQRGSSAIQSNVVVTYSDPTGIGIDTLATITVLNVTVPASEVQFFFRTADGAPAAADPRYEIEPLTITKSGTTITATGHRALFVMPTLWDQPYVTTDPNLNRPNAGDTQNAADFVTQIDCYRVYTDTSANIQLLAGDGTVLETFTGEILEYDGGIYRLGGLCCNSSCWSQPPYTIKVNYRAGLGLVNGFMDNEFMEAIVEFANARMIDKLSGMSSWTLNQWQTHSYPMVANVGNNASISLLSQSDAQNPFGLRTGEVRAWQVANDRRFMKAGKLTQGWKW